MTANSVQGSAPWRITNFSSGKYQHTSSINSTFCGANGILGPGTPTQQKKGKLIFDGYPRTLDQAKNLDLWLTNSDQKIDFIFFLNVNKDTIIQRIKKRKIIENRSDDDLNTIVKRYDKYMETTKPVLDFYSKKSNFYEIDGSGEIDEISSKIEQILSV